MTDQKTLEPKYNHMTQRYEFGDGTSVSAEVVDSVSCLVDVFHIGNIREQQRAARAQGEK